MLRLVNSAAMGRPHKIARIEDAVSFLGRNQLWRWITLLFFAADGGGLTGPLLQTAAHRGRLMEILSSQFYAGDSLQSDRAFLVGMLSLIDALLRRPLEDILPELHVDDVVQSAILKNEGPLGALLKLVQHLEATDYDCVDPLLAKLGIDYPKLQQADNQAYSWIHKLASTPD
jgi:EAL and modified HD-GYP domain-containing signal transduction protein